MKIQQNPDDSQTQMVKSSTWVRKKHWTGAAPTSEFNFARFCGLKTIKITINLKRGMLKKDDVEGTCIWDDWEDLRKTPRDFTIELDSGVTIRNILVNLAHEMVHMKQWVKGDMYEYSNPHMVRFMKKKYDMSDISYWDYPWEIEAFGRQLGLFIRWCETEGIADREDMLEYV